MALLYRGVCDEIDQQNEGELRPKGTTHLIAIRRDGQAKHDGKFTYGPSELNGARAHQIESGLYGGCFVSFTRSEEKACQFATRNSEREKTTGYIYVVDESLLQKHGVIAREFADAQYPNENEITLRAIDNGKLPQEIVIRKQRVNPDEI